MDLAYGTNVHPAESLQSVVGGLDEYWVPVREALGLDRLYLGLWLPAELASALAADPPTTARLRRELDCRGLAVTTLNAFPYRGFHDRVVKRRVYSPSWSDRRRLTYTVDCAQVLAQLLPEDAAFGSLSTLPLGWREPWTPTDDDVATRALADVTSALRRLTARSGRLVVLALEPEPGCVLDTVADAVGWLAPRADPDYVGICLDTCHLAVSFTDPAEAIAQIAASELRVWKTQVSSALHVPSPRDPDATRALAEFAEPRYLHQVRELREDGIRAADDLPDAARRLPGDGPWRVHVHVPLHVLPASPLTGTTPLTRHVLQLLATTPGPEGPPCHVEVETYAWQVLPQRHRQALTEGIAAELAFARANLLPTGASA